MSQDQTHQSFVPQEQPPESYHKIDLLRELLLLLWKWLLKKKKKLYLLSLSNSLRYLSSKTTNSPH